MKQAKITLFVVAVFIWNLASSQTITTIAGNDIFGYNGDGIPAITAELARPMHARPDAFGNIYIADLMNNRIRKVNPSGVITTVAGNGSKYHSGDGAQATAAGVANPWSVAIDNIGNLYVVEQDTVLDFTFGPYWIRKVDTSGIITTIAGNATYNYGGDGGPATLAGLSYVTDIAVDGNGNVFIADAGNGRIRKINNAGVINTVAGDGSSTFSGDGGPALSAGIGTPMGITVDFIGNLYIAQQDSAGGLGPSWLRKVDTVGIITTLAGGGAFGFTGDGGPASAARFADLSSVATDALGNIYLADMLNERIRIINADGIIQTIGGNGHAGHSGDGGPATAAELGDPWGVAVDGGGNIFVADYATSDIRKISPYTAGVNNISICEENALQIYPNPNQGTFTLNIQSAANTSAQITVTNLLGQKIKEMIIATNKETEMQMQVPAGGYFISAVTKNETLTSKIIVK